MATNWKAKYIAEAAAHRDSVTLNDEASKTCRLEIRTLKEKLDRANQELEKKSLGREVDASISQTHEAMVKNARLEGYIERVNQEDEAKLFRDVGPMNDRIEPMDYEVKRTESPFKLPRSR